MPLSALAGHQNWLLADDNDILTPDANTSYGKEQKQLRDYIIKYFLPAFLAGVVMIVILIVARTALVFHRVKLTAFGRGFSEPLIQRYLHISIVNQLCIFVVIAVGWYSNMHFTNGMSSFAVQVAGLGNRIVTELDFALADLIKLMEWYAANVDSETVVEQQKMITNIRPIIKMNKYWTSQGQDLLGAMNEVHLLLHTHLHPHSHQLTSCSCSTHPQVQMIFMFLLYQIALVNCVLGVAAVMRRSERLMRAMVWCSGISLVFFAFSKAISNPIAVAFSALADETGGSNSASAVSNSPMMAMFANCKGEGTMAMDLGGVVSQNKAMFAAMGIQIGVAQNMTMSDYKDLLDRAVQQARNLNTLILSSDVTKLYLNGQLSSSEKYKTVSATEVGQAILIASEIAARLVSVIMCEGQAEHFKAMETLFREDIVKPLTWTVVIQAVLCILCAMNILNGIMGFYILQRPLKTYFAPGSGRWFKFRCCYDAHQSLLKKYKAQAETQGRMRRMLTKMVKSDYWNAPAHSVALVVREIAITYTTAMCLLVPQAAMVAVMIKNTAYVTGICWLILISSFLGLYGSCAHVDDSKGVVCMLLSNLFCAVNIVMLLNRIAGNASKAMGCADRISLPSKCTFEEQAVLVEDALFMSVLLLVSVVVLITGITFFCLRKRAVTNGLLRIQNFRSLDQTPDTDNSKREAKVTPERDGEGVVESDAGDGSGGSGGGGGGKHLRVWAAMRAFSIGEKVTVALVLASCFLWALPDGSLISINTARLTQNAANRTLAPPPPRAKSCATCCNGFAALCSRRYDQVAYFTSHNMMSSNDASWIVANNRWGVKLGLEYGVRGLMLDTHPEYYEVAASGVNDDDDDDDDDDEGIYAPKGKALLCHGLCALGSSPLVETLKIIVQWLEDNPREVQRASRVNLALCVFLCMSLFKVHACRIGAYL
jgi:hypothetical protein